MVHDLSHPPPHNLDQSQESPLSGSVTSSAGNGVAGTLPEEKEHMSSVSQKSSPILTSILMQPSGPGGPRPRSSESRVSSLNLPKYSSHMSRQITSHPSSSRRRVVSRTHANAIGQEVNGPVNSQPDDGILNFGLGDEYALGPEDPDVLADVQKALKTKALREARSKSGASTPSSASPRKVALSEVRHSPDPRSLAPSSSQISPVTPPRPVASGSTHSTTPSPSAFPRITSPPYIHFPSRSLESISSEGRSTRSPLPIRVYLPDGSSYLDWSGALPEDIVSQKDRKFLGRRFSLTKRKGKEKDRRKGTPGRHSVDLEGSQGDLHAAQLDNIRRAAKRETLSRAEITKDELGRRYNSLIPHKPTGEPTLDILEVVKSPQVNGRLHTPWLAWCNRRAVHRQNTNIWTITANSVDDSLQGGGRSPTNSSFASPSKPLIISSQRSHSPLYGLSSPFSSRSSISTSPNQNDGARKDRMRLELNRSLSANPVIEGIASTSLPTSPTLYRSLSLTQAPTYIDLSPPSPGQPRRSIDAMISPNPATSSFPNLSHSPRSSLDQGPRPQLVSSAPSAEKDSFRKRVRLSLSGDRFSPTTESRSSTMSSLANLFNVTPITGAPVTSSRLHLGVSNMFGMMKRSGEENGEGRYRQSRSSVSDERDSGRDGEGTKSDDPVGLTRQEKARIAPIFDGRGMKSRGKGTSNTSDSDLGGYLVGKLVPKFHRPERDRDKVHSAEDTTEEVRGSISGNEQRPADALATPGWTSKRGIRYPRASASKEISHEKLQEMLQREEEEEELSKEVYKTRELMLIETNDHNRRIGRLLKAVCSLIKEHETVQSELAQTVGAQYTQMPQEVMDVISADPATALRHGRGWRAVEESHQRFLGQQALLASYLSTLMAEPKCLSVLGHLIQEANQLWRDLLVKSEEIDKKCMVVKPALNTAVAHMEKLQKEYNAVHILVETDYPEQTRIADLEMIITESRSPRGWLEFAAFWIPEHVLEFIGGFIRFFGVPISEKFIRPFLWYFLRNRYYWKIYSTEPPPSERAWYTRLGYWVVILSILAWYTTA